MNFFSILKASLRLMAVLIVSVVVLKDFASAEEYLIRITDQKNLPVIANVYGNHGVRNHPIKTTDNKGYWRVDTDDLLSQYPTITFANVDQNLSFSPAIFTLSDVACPLTYNEDLQRSILTCEVKARNDQGTSHAVLWRVSGISGGGAPGVPVTIPQSEQNCPQYTDEEGFAIFSVTEPSFACTSSANTRQHVIVGDLEHVTCTATDKVNSLSFCAQESGNLIQGSALISCVVSSPDSGLSSLPVTVKVTNQLGAPIAGVSVYITPTNTDALFKTITNFSGEIQFSRTDSRLAPTGTRKVYFAAPGYSFEHDFIEIGRSKNKYTVRAVPDYYGTSLLKFSVQENSAPLSGVNIDINRARSCGIKDRLWTGVTGSVVASVPRRSSCSNSDFTLINDYLITNPISPGCQFSLSNNLNPKLYCPQAVEEALNFVATCGDSIPVDVLVSGTILDVKGLPMAGTEVLTISPETNTDVVVAVSDQNGEYSFLAQRDKKLTIYPRNGDWEFDAAVLSFVEVTEKMPRINFRAVTKHTGLPKLPKAPACDAKESNEISGYVRDQFNSGVPNTAIYVNDQKVATTNSVGHYSVQVEPLKNYWIYPEHVDYQFLPAGIGVYKVMCDLVDQVNFYVTEEDSYLVGGKVTTEYGSPVRDVQVTISYRLSYDDSKGSSVLTAMTDQEGRYKFSLPEDRYFEITFSKTSWRFDPELLSGIVGSDLSWDEFDGRQDYDTIGIPLGYGVPSPSPSSSPSSSPSPSPSVSSMPSASASVSAQPSASPSNSPSPIMSPSSSASASISPSSSASPSTSASPSPSASASPSASPTVIPDSAPSLISPIGSVSEVVEFTWTSVDKATKYQVSISKDNTSETEVFDNIEATLMESPAFVEAGYSYNWKVRGGTDDGWGPWSDSGHFTYDLCLEDPDKLLPGVCGCNIPDVDDDLNGLEDCLEDVCSEDNIISLNFEELLKGEVVANQYDYLGVNISGFNNNSAHPHKIATLDSSDPGQNDLALGTPNVSYSGPGIGDGSGNTENLGKVLVITNNDIDVSSLDNLNVPLCVMGDYGYETLWVDYRLRSDYMSEGASSGECGEQSSLSSSAEKVIICHYPPGNPENPQSLKVSQSAVETHLTQHGDYLGKCRNNEDNDDDDQNHDDGGDQNDDDDDQNHDDGGDRNDGDSEEDDDNIPTEDDGSEHRVKICHKAGDKFHTIEIDKHGLKGHLLHGDSEGVCEEVPSEGDGLIDNPSAELSGGKFILNFKKPVHFRSNQLVNLINNGQVFGSLREQIKYELELNGIGSNSVDVTDIESKLEGGRNKFVDLVVIEVSNPVALSEIQYCPSKKFVKPQPKITPDIEVEELCTSTEGQYRVQLSNVDQFDANLSWDLLVGGQLVKDDVLILNQGDKTEIEILKAGDLEHKFVLKYRGDVVSETILNGLDCGVSAAIACYPYLVDGDYIFWDVRHTSEVARTYTWKIRENGKTGVVTLDPKGRAFIPFESDSNVYYFDVFDQSNFLVATMFGSRNVCNTNIDLKAPVISNPTGVIFTQYSGLHDLGFYWEDQMPSQEGFENQGYEIEIADPNGQVVNSGFLPGVKYDVEDVFKIDTQYSWRIRIRVTYRGQNYYSAWSNSLGFEFVYRPMPFIKPPKPISPDGASPHSFKYTYEDQNTDLLADGFDLISKSYDIKMESVDTGESYEIQKTDSDSQLSPIYSGTLPPGRYRWAIRATYMFHYSGYNYGLGPSSEWSDYKEFTIAGVYVPPITVYGITPNDSERFDNPPEFKWSNVANLTHSYISVSTTADMANIVYRYDTSGSSQTYTPSESLNPYQGYYWTVLVMDSTGNSGESAPMYFELKLPVPLPTYSISGELRDARNSGAPIYDSDGNLNPKSQTLVNKISNLPLSKLWVKAYNKETRMTSRADFDADSLRFAIDGLPKGNYNFELMYDGDAKVVTRSMTLDGTVSSPTPRTNYKGLLLDRNMDNLNFSIRVTNVKSKSNGSNSNSNSNDSSSGNLDNNSGTGKDSSGKKDSENTNDKSDKTDNGSNGKDISDKPKKDGNAKNEDGNSKGKDKGIESNPKNGKNDSKSDSKAKKDQGSKNSSDRNSESDNSKSKDRSGDSNGEVGDKKKDSKSDSGDKVSKDDKKSKKDSVSDDSGKDEENKKSKNSKDSRDSKDSKDSKKSEGGKSGKKDKKNKESKTKTRDKGSSKKVTKGWNDNLDQVQSNAKSKKKKSSFDGSWN